MRFLFQHPMPVLWLLADVLTILVTFIRFTIAGGFYIILWLVLLASLVHFASLGMVYFSGKRVRPKNENYLFEP